MTEKTLKEMDEIAMHAVRVEDVERFIVDAIDRELTPDEKRLLDKVPEQILHLLSAAIIEKGSVK